MKKTATSFGLHLLLFIVIEIIFVFIVFREWPETNLLSAIGIGHTIYRGILILAGVVRTKAKKVATKFIATYFPLVIHLLLHVYIVGETVHEHAGEEHHEDIWLWLGVLLFGVLIYIGEYLLHRKFHCDTHHHIAHEQCCKKGHEDCETPHT